MRSNTSTASRKYRRSLPARRPFVGPLKRAVGKTIVIGNECEDTLAQMSHGCPTSASQQTSNKNTEPDLNLVEPRAVSRRIDEANTMGRIRKKGGPRFHRGENPAFAFATPVLSDAALLSYQTNQRFRLMGDELISEKEPGRIRISLDGLSNMSSKISFGACRS